MGRHKALVAVSDREEQAGSKRVVAEAIQAKRQACLEALKQPIPLTVLSLVQEVAGLSCPSRPSLPLAQASKLAAHCAVALHLRREKYGLPKSKLQDVVLNLIAKATRLAWEGDPQRLCSPCVCCSSPPIGLCNPVIEQMLAAALIPWSLHIRLNMSLSPANELH